MQRNAILGFASGLAVLIIVTIVGELATQTLAETTELVQHTHRGIETIGDIDDALDEMQAAKRAFVVTGDEAYLARYKSGQVRADEVRVRLRRLISDNLRQTARLDELDVALAERLKWLEAGIAARRERGFDLAVESDNIHAGSEVSDAIRRKLDDLKAEELQLLEVRERASVRSTTRERIVQIGGMLVSTLIFGITFVRLRSESRRRLASEQAARENAQSLATMLHSIGDGVISTDADARVTRMNPVAERLTGWRSDEARGKPFREVFNIVNEQTRAPAVDPVERVLVDRIPVGLANHTALIARDGTERAIADSAAPIFDAHGALTGVVLVFRDAEAERSFLRRISEANAFLDSIVENIPNMIFVKDAGELRFVRFNRAGEELLGTTRDALIGKSDHDLFPESQASFFQDKDRAVLAGEVAVDIPEEPLETPRGTRWLHTKKIPIRDGEGRARFLLGISEDITERKQFQDQLRQLNDDLERRVKERTEALARSEEQLRQSQKIEAIGRLAGGIAHDFNNLLSVILSYTEMMVEDLAEEDPMRVDLVEVNKAGKRAAELTRQLLAFSRQQVLAPQVVDLSSIVSGMETLLRRVIGEHIELRFVPTVIPKVMVDPGQMEQVIMNLVVNARDAMPRGGRLTIETQAVELAAEYAAEHRDVARGPHVMLAISDTGQGMDKATQSRIFEPFFTTKEKGKGTGLGLSTVFGIVKQSGGSIWVYSEVGSGTVFKIYLPVARAEAAATPHAPAEKSKAGGSETVLLVEDEAQVRALARSILSRSGYQVLEAVDGHDALRLCERFSGTIHLVVTDVVMPKLSGRELIEKLAVLRPKIKVLFMSGYTDDTVVHHGVIDERIAFLQKPLTPDTLLKKVREALSSEPAA